MATKHYIVTSVLSLALLASCTSDDMRTGVAGATISQDRSAREISSDSLLQSNIKNQLAQNDRLTLIGVKVSEGKVLLTGKVSTLRDRFEASKIAWQEPEVQNVKNRITVTSNTGKSGEYSATDTVITSEIKSRLLLARNVRSMNYSFETIDGVVYILGIAQNQNELNEVINIVEEIPGVKTVESYVRVKY